MSLNCVCCLLFRSYHVSQHHLKKFLLGTLCVFLKRLVMKYCLLVLTAAKIWQAVIIISSRGCLGFSGRYYRNLESCIAQCMDEEFGRDWEVTGNPEDRHRRVLNNDSRDMVWSKVGKEDKHTKMP